VKFGFVAKHRGIWPADWLCEALGVSRGGFYAWLTRPRSRRSRSEEELGAKVRASFLASDRTYGARRVWHDLLAEGVSCGLHRIERLMRLQALKARPRRRRLPPDLGERLAAAVASNVLDRSFEAAAPNRKWIADFTYVWTAEGWLYVAAVVDLFSRRVVGWSMSAAMTAQLVTDALVMAIWRRGKNSRAYARWLLGSNSLFNANAPAFAGPLTLKIQFNGSGGFLTYMSLAPNAYVSALGSCGEAQCRNFVWSGLRLCHSR
jgi:putative transposase